MEPAFSAALRPAPARQSPARRDPGAAELWGQALDGDAKSAHLRARTSKRAMVPILKRLQRHPITAAG